MVAMVPLTSFVLTLDQGHTLLIRLLLFSVSSTYRDF